MNLDEFIAGSLKGIIDGVGAAQVYAKGCDAKVNPQGLAAREDHH